MWYGFIGPKYYKTMSFEVERIKVIENEASPMLVGDTGTVIKLFRNLRNRSGKGCAALFKQYDGSRIRIVLYEEEFKIINNMIG